MLQNEVLLWKHVSQLKIRTPCLNDKLYVSFSEHKQTI